MSDHDRKAAIRCESRTCPVCGQDVLVRVARATFTNAWGRKPKATKYPVVVQCTKGHYVEYAPVPDLNLARAVRYV